MNKPISPVILQNLPAQDAECGAPGSGNVSALERGISVLRCFDENVSALSNQQLAQLTGIPKPTLTRLTATLVNLGLLKQDAARDHYMLGPGIMPMARAFLATLDFRACARPLMQEFAEANEGASVYIGLHDDLSMVVVEACRARSSMLSARIDVGSRLPIPNSALGRAFLSVCDEAERQQVVDRFKESAPDKWNQHEFGLMKALQRGAQDGYLMSLGEWHRDINSVSVGFRNAQGEILSLNAGGAAYIFPEERLRWDIAPKLHQLGTQIALKIGGFPPAPLKAGA